MLENQFRQLAAIMFVDIKGFTKKMEEDETTATAMRQKLDNGLKEFLPVHNGRIIKQMGDGALCLFNSAIEAVNAAIRLQLRMRSEPLVPVRIGIHTGDVIIEENDVYGDGVNIASRVESFAFAGGVFMSGKVYDEIKNQHDIKTIALGKFEFTNVKDPVEVYAVCNDGIAVPDVKRMEGKGISAYKRRRTKQRYIIAGITALAVVTALCALVYKAPVAIRKYTIAVMPFKNMSDSKETDFFSDGITEDILTQISKINDLSVLSRSTTMQLKNNGKTFQQLGEELNVGYILEGSVRRAVNQIRISAQLTDAATGQNVWAETYDREYSKIFEIQSEIARFIAIVLKTKLSAAAKKSINKIPTTSLSAYEHYLRGRDFYYKVSKNQNTLAVAEFKTAIELDGNYALAWAGLADAYSQKFRLGLPGSWLDSGKLASEKAISIDTTSSEAYKSLANFYLYTTNYQKAKYWLLKSIALNPNNAAAVGNLGSCYFLLGQLDEALKWEKKSAVLEPKKSVAFYIVGWIYRILGDYNLSEQWLLKSLEVSPYTDAYDELAFTYILAGRPKEAKAVIPKMIALDTNSAENYQAAGLIAQMLGEHETASQYFLRATDLHVDGFNDPDFFAPLGVAWLKRKEGKKVDAEIILSKAVTMYPDSTLISANNYDRYVFAAAAFAMEDQRDLALYYLNKAADANWMDYTFAEKNQWFENISKTPGFKTLMEHLKAKAIDFRHKSDM